MISFPLPVRSDRFVEGNLFPVFFLRAEVHKDFVFYTPGCVCCKPVSLLWIKSDDGLDQTDRTDGDQILRILVQILIFLYDMCDEPEITFDENMLCLEVSLRIFLDVVLLFRRCEGLGNDFKTAPLSAFDIVYEKCRKLCFSKEKTEESRKQLTGTGGCLIIILHSRENLSRQSFQAVSAEFSAAVNRRRAGRPAGTWKYA